MRKERIALDDGSSEDRSQLCWVTAVVCRLLYHPAVRTAARTFVFVLICTTACHAQTARDQVVAVYKRMEKAVQVGDAKVFVGLWSRESASDAQKLRAQLQPQPDVHYTSSKVFVQGDEAALLGQYGTGQFLCVRFVREDGSWKIRDVTLAIRRTPQSRFML